MYKKHILEIPYPKLEITDQIIKNIKEKPTFFLDCPVRVATGRIYTDAEFKKRRDEIINRPLPDGTKVSRRKMFKRKNK